MLKELLKPEILELIEARNWPGPRDALADWPAPRSPTCWCVAALPDDDNDEDSAPPPGGRAEARPYGRTSQKPHQTTGR